MSVNINARNQRLLAWCGPVLTVMFLVGFILLARFIPPPAPGKSIDATIRFFETDTDLKRIGLWLNTFAGAMSGAWVVAISMQMRRIEGYRSSPLAYVQMLMGALLVFEFIIPVELWQACLYRPSLSPEFTYRLNDLAWLFFVGVVATAVVECIAIGLAVLQDKRSDPVFPRWVGYFNLWMALLFLPGGFVVFFKSGPLAWNGVLAFWLVLTAFTLWLLVMSYSLLVHAIPQQEREEREGRENWNADEVSKPPEAVAAP